MSLFDNLFRRSADVAERVEPQIAATSEPVPTGGASARVDLSSDAFWGGGSVGRVKGLPVATPRSAERHATVFGCCNVIAGDLAKLPLRVMEGERGGVSEVVNDHPANFLLNVEASEGVPAKLTKFGLAYQFLLQGVSYASAPRDAGGDLTLLEQVFSVSVLRDGRKRVYTFEDGEGVQRTVPARAMVHLRYGAIDGWTHRSPLMVAADSVGLVLANQDAAGRSASGSTSKAVANLASFAGADDAQYERDKERLRKAWNDGDGGVTIIGPDDKLEKLGLSATDMQLLESRKFDREMIAGIYRVPPSKLQMLEHGVKANGQQQAIDYRTDCLLHWGGFFAEGLGQALLTAGERSRGLFLEFDYRPLLLPTTKELYEALNKAVGGPFMVYDEAREIANLGKLPDGKRPYPPPNMTRKEEGNGDE